MDLNYELIKARVVNCYNSLIIDVKLSDDSIVPVFCASSEAVALCCKNLGVSIKRTENKSRKIKYELVYINRNEGVIFVEPSINRKLFIEAFEQKRLPDFAAYTDCRAIERDDHMFHIDFELSNNNGEKCFVFIENVYNKIGGFSVFPAGINFFELEMFEEMARLRALGHSTAVFMLVPRQDCTEAKFSWNLDPVAAAKIYDEAKNGLKFVCYGCILDKKSVSIAAKMKILY